MNTTTAAVDLAKNVYQVAIATSGSASIEQHRLTRIQFERFFANRHVDRIVMEACGSAHHHARRLAAQGFEVILLPAQYVRAYVRRNKTDSADARALLEAAKAPDIRPVRVKSVEQQSLQVSRAIQFSPLWQSKFPHPVENRRRPGFGSGRP